MKPEFAHSSSFTCSLLVAAALGTWSTFAQAQPYAAARTLLGVTYHVSASGEGSVQQLLVRVEGLAPPAEPIRREILGSVTGVEATDLDGNGHSELLVFVAGAGSGSHGEVIGYAVNRGRSITPIFMPELTPSQARGYMGHDRFAVEGHRLVRTFPVYLPNDVNASPTGGARRIAYALVPGEAGWQFRVSSVRSRPPQTPTAPR